MQHEKMVILGSGPAGLTAAIYAARAELQPLLIEGIQPGGQLTTTTEVENWPGNPEGIQGTELMALMRKQAERFGTRIISGNVVRTDLSARPFGIWLEDGTEYRAETLIVATGASAKWLGLPNEQRLRGHGVSACATCDGFFFKGKDIAIVGGGDAAMEEANFLTKFANSVTVLVRGTELRASKIMQERAMANPKIKWIYQSEVADVLGENAVSGLRLKHSKTGEMSEIKVQGLFVAIGHEPNTKIFGDQLELAKGYLVTKSGSSETSVPGVFAAGDVADWKYRQAITAAGSGCMAALDAERFLANHEK